MTETQRLLADYVENHSEHAFRELVARYLDLVYSTALRLVGNDAHLAEDVTQTVFADVARKARALPSDVTLGGWLHRHTCFVASKLMRGERRRQSRERQAVEMNAQPDHSEANLRQLAPVLDEAINQLGAEDRTAILLRFFEQQDLRSVGEVLGSSENAAQKRIRRALEELRTLLARRGVAFSATTLGTALAAQAVSAAPIGLAATISTTALAGGAIGGGATLTLLKGMTMTKLQVGVVSAVVVAGVATPILLNHDGKLRAENGALREQYEHLSLQPDTPEPTAGSFVGTQFSASPSGSPSDELLRLRGEAARLRLELAEMQVPSNIFRLVQETQAKAFAEATQNGILLSEEEKQAGFPKESWTFSGYATPKAAVLSLMWAQSQADPKTIFASYTPDALEWKLEHQWKGKSETQIAQLIQQGVSNISSFRFSSQTLLFQEGDRVVFRLTPYDSAGNPRPGINFSLQKIGNEWKSCNKGYNQTPAQP